MAISRQCNYIQLNTRLARACVCNKKTHRDGGNETHPCGWSHSSVIYICTISSLNVNFYSGKSKQILIV